MKQFCFEHLQSSDSNLLDISESEEFDGGGENQSLQQSCQKREAGSSVSCFAVSIYHQFTIVDVIIPNQCSFPFLLIPDPWT